MISPWGSPARVWTPAPITRPPCTSTHPTGGFGLDKPTPFNPSRRARAMKRASPDWPSGSGQGPPVARAQATSGVRSRSGIQKPVHEGPGVERDEVVHTLAHAHEGDGELQAIQDGDHHAPLGAAVQLREHQVRDAGD